jgi:hypothetical protein
LKSRRQRQFGNYFKHRIGAHHLDCGVLEREEEVRYAGRERVDGSEEDTGSELLEFG